MASINYTKWVFNSSIEFPQEYLTTMPINMYVACPEIRSGYTNFTADSLYIGKTSDAIIKYGDTIVYQNNAWVNDGYKTIMLTNKTSTETYDDVFSWLNTVATQIPNTSVSARHLNNTTPTTGGSTNLLALNYSPPLYNATAAQSTYLGLPEFFEAEFPEGYATCCFYIINGNLAPVQVRVINMNALPEYTSLTTFTIGKNNLCRVDVSAKSLRKNNKAAIWVNPGSAASTSSSGVYVIAYYTNDELNPTDPNVKLINGTQLDNNLTSVANAIRTKGGISAMLRFPTDFVTAINAIPTGGTSEWEEVDLGGTGSIWDVYVIIDQSTNWMHASCSVTGGTQTKTQEGQDISRIHFKNVPQNTTVSYTGNGDDFHYAWAKMDTYVSVDSSSGTQPGSTTTSNGHTGTGHLMLLISSPET